MDHKWIKFAAWIAGVLLALLLALFVTVRLLLPAEKIKSLAEQRITLASGHRCSIEDLGLSLWHGLAIDLSGVELAPGDGEAIPYTARLEHLYLRLKLMPLLKRRVEVVSLIVDQPELFIVRDKGGELNLSKLREKERKAEPQPEDEAFKLVLLKVVVDDAVLHYYDYQDSTRVTLAGIGGELNMVPVDPDTDIPISGSLRVEELREINPGSPQDFAKALPASAGFDGTVAWDWSWIELTRVTFTAGGVQLDGPLRLDLKGDNTTWRLELDGGATDPGMLSELLLPAGFPRKITDFELKLATDGNTLVIEKLETILGPDRLVLSGTLELAEPYRAYADLDARLTMEGLKDFSGAESRWSGSGELNARLNLRAELKQALDTWSAGGTISSGEISLALPENNLDVKLSGLQARLAGRNIERLSLSAAAGKSDLKADLSVTNWPGLLPPKNPLSSGRTRWKLSANSKTIDFVELFGQDHALLDTLIARAAADTSEMPVVLGDGAASLNVGTLVARRGVELGNAGLWLTVRDSLLRVDSLSAGLFGGKLAGAGDFVMAAAGLESWRMNLRASDVSAGELLRPFSSFGKYINGTVDTGMDLRNGRAQAASSLAALAGVIDFSLSDGAVRELPALNAVSGLTKIDELRDLAIDDWVGKFEIRDGRVFGDDLKMNTSVGLIGAGGSVGLDGSLDYRLILALNQHLSDKYRSKLPGEIGRLLTGGSGNIELSFDLAGTTAEPTVKLNTATIARRAGEQLKQGVSKLIGKLLPDKSAPSDSTAPDSSSQLKKALPKLLNKLLKKSPSKN